MNNIDEARMHVRTSIVKAVMDGADKRVKVEELDGGMPVGIMATHKVVFHDHVVYCASEKDAKTVEAAFLALILSLAVKFAGELTSEPAGGKGGE